MITLRKAKANQMADYKIYLTRSAIKQLDKLNDKQASPIIEAIKQLSKNPYPAGYIKLKGRSAFRIRKGNFRIIYELNDQDLIITIIAIGNRKNVYKK